MLKNDFERDWVGVCGATCEVYLTF
jgi:hypothetical protein